MHIRAYGPSLAPISRTGRQSLLMPSSASQESYNPVCMDVILGKYRVRLMSLAGCNSF